MAQSKPQTPVSQPPAKQTEVERELEKMRDDDDALGLAREHFEAIKTKRNLIDWRFRIAEMFERDQIYARYNKYTRDIETPKPKRGEIRTELPIISTLVNQNITFLTKDKPQWDVQPDSYSDEDVKEAQWNNLLLDYAARTGGLEEKIEQVVRSGIVKSIGILQVQFNPDTQKIEFDTTRPEDFYVNPQSDSFHDAPALVKIISKDIGLIRNSPRYKAKKSEWWDNLKPDIEVTANDELKRVMWDDTGTSEQTDVGGARGSVLLAECYLKFFEKGKTEPKYRMVVFPVNQPMLLMNEVVEYGRMPWFFPFCTDKRPGEIYGRGKVLPVVSPVKAICNIASKLSRFMEIFVDGTYIVDRGANPMVVQGEAGKIIYKQPGRGLQALTPPQFPTAAFEHMQFLMSSVQDSMGVHDVTMGRAAKGVDSARGIEGMLHGDVQAKSTLVSQLSRTLSEAGKYVLLLYNKNLSDQQIIKIYDDNGLAQNFTAKGGDTFQSQDHAAQFNQYDDTLVVKPKENVNVVIGSGLGNTPQGRLDAANNLRAQGAIDVKTLLKVAQVPGNISAIADQASQEAMQAEQARQGQPPQTDEKDYVNVRLPDLSVQERAQQLQKLGIHATMDPTMIPGTPLYQGAVADAKLHPELQKMHAQQEISMHANMAGQEGASLNPSIPGGAVDPTQGAPGQLAINPGQPPEPNGGQSG